MVKIRIKSRKDHLDCLVPENNQKAARQSAYWAKNEKKDYLFVILLYNNTLLCYQYA